MHYIYTHKNLAINAIVRSPHPRSGCSQRQETILAPSADNKTRNYDTECSIYTFIVKMQNICNLIG